MKKKNILLNIILTIAITIAIFATLKILTSVKETKQTNKITETIQEQIKITEEKDTENTIIIENNNIPESNPYFDYIKVNLMNVNFSELKSINNDTVGWISLEGTTINYPFVQTTNNTYYLNHSFDKSYNKAGWVFLDYRNNLKIPEKNTILYAHNRLDNTMFGSLKKTLEDNWSNNKNNHIIKISTEYENSLWQVFSIYRITKTNDYIKTTFKSEDSFKSFLDLITKRSEKQFETTVSTNDRIITLSTCHKDKERFVLHAKLIKYEKKEV